MFYLTANIRSHYCVGLKPIDDILRVYDEHLRWLDWPYNGLASSYLQVRYYVLKRKESKKLLYVIMYPKKVASFQLGRWNRARLHTHKFRQAKKKEGK